MDQIKNLVAVSSLLRTQKTPLISMAKAEYMCLLLFFLFVLTGSASGTLVGFSCNTKGISATSSLSRTISFLELNKASALHIRVFAADHRVLSTLSNFNVSVDLCLDEESMINFTPSWLKSQIITSLPLVKSFIVSASNDFSKLLSALKSIHSVLKRFRVENHIKVSVAFSLSFLENLNTTQENDLKMVFGFVKRSGSFIIVGSSVDIDAKLGMGYDFVQSMIHKVAHATSFLPCNDVPIVITIKSLGFPTAKQVSEFADRVSESLTSNQLNQVAGLYAELSATEDFETQELKREHEQKFPSSRRELLNNFKTTLHDGTFSPSTMFPTNPASTPPVTLLPDTPTPTVVTVPATNPANPVTVTPTNPVPTPLPFPYTAPVNVPPTNPAVNPPVPVTTPAPITVPGAPPVSNPVTTYPAPTGNPVTNPVAPPATTNAPAIPGQSWCVARSGALQASLQSALDYACGMGGADCSQIQQGGNCYMPNTLQNHASYAFNSYYQKNPAATSCDFGGTATIVNVNPSTGSCIYPSSSSSTPTSSLPTPSTSSTNPATTTPGVGESGTPPSVLNSSTNPASSFGSTDAPPVVNPSASNSATFQPVIGSIILLTSLVAKTIILDM